MRFSYGRYIYFNSQIADGATLLSLQENNIISLPTSGESEQFDASQLSVAKDEQRTPVDSDSEIKQNNKPTTHGEIGSELIGTFLNSEASTCTAIKDKEEDFCAKKPDDFTTYIRTLLTQSQDGVTDSSSQEETDEPVPDTATTTEVQPLAKTIPQVAIYFERTWKI